MPKSVRGPTSTGWLSRTNFTADDYLAADDLNFLGLDIRNWGGDVNAGGYRLTNVIVSGSMDIQRAASPIEIVAGSGGTALTQYDVAGTPSPVARWTTGKDAAAESGGNSGSNYAITRLSDAGAVIDTPFSISRQTGLISLGSQFWTGPVNANGQTLSNVVIPGVLTDPTTAKGDLLARGASALVRVPVGPDGQALFADSTQPGGVKWASMWRSASVETATLCT